MPMNRIEKNRCDVTGIHFLLCKGGRRELIPEVEWNKKELSIVKEPFSPLTSKHALVLWGLGGKSGIDLILPWMEGTQCCRDFKAPPPHPYRLCQCTR